MDVIIVPDKGMAAEIGRHLLALADSPSDVGWVSWPEAGFKVPQELANRFHAANKGDTQDEDVTQPVKRRGRPPKQKPVTDTDEENKEE